MRQMPAFNALVIFIFVWIGVSIFGDESCYQRMQWPEDCQVLVNLPPAGSPDKSFITTREEIGATTEFYYYLPISCASPAAVSGWKAHLDELFKRADIIGVPP